MSASLPTNCQYHWLEKLFNKIKQVDPPRIDKTFVTMVEGNNHESSILKLAQFLEIANADGGRGRNYDLLRDYGSNSFKENLQRIIKEKYSGVFNHVDLSTATRESVTNLVKANYIQDHARSQRALNVLVDLCKLSGIELSVSLLTRAAPNTSNNQIHSGMHKVKADNPVITKMSEKSQSMAKVAEWIRTNREKAEMSQAELAAKLGVWQPQISAWESGKASPAREMLQRLAATLGVELDSKDVGVGLGEWLRKRREQLGLSRAKLAEKAGISSLTVYFIETGRTESPTRTTVDALEKILGKMPGNVKEEVSEESRVEEFEFLGPFPCSEWRDNINSETKIPCLYVFYDELKRPVRIGQTDDLRRRMLEYEKNYWWFKPPTADTFAYVIVKDGPFRDKTEKLMIKLVGTHAIFNTHEKI